MWRHHQGDSYTNIKSTEAHPLQVTPSSKVVGDFAQWMTSNSFSKKDVLEKAENLDFPSSVVEFFQGYLGQPVGGFPEPLRSQIIRNKKKIDERPGISMEPLDFKKIKAELRSKYGKHINSADVTSHVMYPKVRLALLAGCKQAKNRNVPGVRGVPRILGEIRRSQVS